MPNTLSRCALHGDKTEQAPIEMRSPVSVHSLPVVRSLVSAMTIEADFDGDRVEDTRLLIDELCSTLLRSNVACGGPMRCRFRIDEQGLRIEASVPVLGPTEVDRQRFGWRTLVTLADTMESWCEQAHAADGAATGRWRLHIAAAMGRSKKR